MQLRCRTPSRLSRAASTRWEGRANSIATKRIRQCRISHRPPPRQQADERVPHSAPGANERQKSPGERGGESSCKAGAEHVGWRQPGRPVGPRAGFIDVRVVGWGRSPGARSPTCGRSGVRFAQDGTDSVGNGCGFSHSGACHRLRPDVYRLVAGQGYGCSDGREQKDERRHHTGSEGPTARPARQTDQTWWCVATPWPLGRGTLNHRRPDTRGLGFGTGGPFGGGGSRAHRHRRCQTARE